VAAPHPDDRGWIAAAGAGSGESSGTERRLGCIFCMRQDAHTARLRLFLVEPDWRGTGLARRLLAACLAHARARGYDRMALTTHDSHRAACRLYEKAGFERGPAVPTRSYGRDLHVVPFTKALRAGPSGLASRAGRS
jgi:GNAT superfamily N-acetyltransferase